jgi:hypothetical protein
MNFCEEPEWLAFRIASGVLVWETPTDGPPLSSCIASPTREKAVRLHEAMDWLREALKDEDQPAAVMNRQARAQGFSDMTVRRACERLMIRHIRCEFGPVGLWMWALPKPVEEPDEKAVSSPNEPPPDPPLRRGGTTGSEPRASLRKGGRIRSGKSPKGTNARRKEPVASPPIPRVLDGVSFNTAWRALFREALAGLAGEEWQPSTGKGAKAAPNGDLPSNRRSKKPR